MSATTPSQPLKPCPFCGEAAAFERLGSGRQSCIVACGSCGARHESGDSGDLSGRSWNRRHGAFNPNARDPVAAKLEADEDGLLRVKHALMGLRIYGNSNAPDLMVAAIRGRAVEVVELEAEAERLRDVRDALKRQNSALENELRNVLASATPNDRDHPAMWAAWSRAQDFLKRAPNDAPPPDSPIAEAPPAQTSVSGVVVDARPVWEADGTCDQCREALGPPHHALQRLAAGVADEFRAAGLRSQFLTPPSAFEIVMRGIPIARICPPCAQRFASRCALVVLWWWR